MTDVEARCLVIACGALVREIQHVIGVNNLAAIEIAAIPALFHNRPEKITPAVAEKIREARGKFDKIFVAYADCGTGGDLDRLLELEGIERLPGAHCYAFYSGVSDFERRNDDITSFFLTDFLARQFESLIIKGLGIDRHPELRDAYFGNYRKVVYLSQSPTPELIAKAEQAAVALALEFEHRHVGYGDLETMLNSKLA